MASLASLPMYDWPEIRAEVDAFYAALRQPLLAAGFAAPEQLIRSEDPLPVWRSEALLLSQTCGLPYVRLLRDRVQLVGTPEFGLPGCDAGHYASAVVVHRDNPATDFAALRGTTAVVNGFDSQSGFAALNHLVMRVEGDANFFAATAVSGSHRRSAACVAAGDAAVCAIDPVSWQLIQDWDRDTAARLRVLDWSDRVPALPLITAGKRAADELDVLRSVLQQALVDPAVARAASALYIEGLAPLNDSHYDVVADGWATQTALGLTKRSAI
ncbi:MAG: PhnD/SsuA/transferrin family substrate-binding protein [Pseudomonadota bacterium]